MNRYIRYLGMQLKRTRRLLLPILWATLLVFVGVVLAASILFAGEDSAEVKQKVKIGITGDLSGSYLQVGIDMFVKLDSSSFYFTYEIMSEEEAKEALYDGQISAYVKIPDGFVEAAARGEFLPATYVTNAGDVSVVSIVKNELADLISGIVTQSEHAIYATGEYLFINGRAEEYGEQTDRIFLRLLDFILSRSDMYETEQLGALNGLSFVGYYLCALFVLFVLLWGVVGSPLLTGRDHAMAKLLQSRGICAAGQVLCEYAAYLLLMTGSVLSVTALLLGGMSYLQWLPGEWTDIRDGISFFAEALPVLMLLAAMQYFFYELVNGTVNGILVQFFLIIGMGYVAGCFYPISFFPQSVQQLAQYLPAGAARQYMECCFLGQGEWGSLPVMALYLAAFLGLSVWIRIGRLHDED